VASYQGCQSFSKKNRIVSVALRPTGRHQILHDTMFSRETRNSNDLDVFSRFYHWAICMDIWNYLKIQYELLECKV
jgi:hypothetical protein